MILAGDIGGTKTVLALFDPADGGLRQVREQSYRSQSYATFEQILTEFQPERTTGPVLSACFGVAGMVVSGGSHTTNLPWQLEERALEEQLGIPHVKLLNDLEAAAYGMLHLSADEQSVLQSGATGPREGNLALIAAGTGLGEAMLYWDGQLFHPIASEGGHADFGPASPIEVELLQYLAEKFHGHVSWERVLSGPGFSNIYTFLRDTGRFAEAPELTEKFQLGDPNRWISEAGIAGTDPLSAATVALFCSIYGSEAGNLALRSVAVGGVFVGGGIAPKILTALRRGEFLKAFSAKGRFAEFLQHLDVRVSLNPKAPLVGAAYYSLRLHTQ
ncbi:glucokinase [Singulisphaera sp. GP187]|uniref:glucokinase n=1 Tax=Singulisphaera sp. GP187 TaxID=1882752 RepID=UPI00092636A1|nr:glucokinase [Singulisphaera sp. GP187]SIO61232.1 glucokinase [Singulisphaera sp. GP187]